MASFEVADSGVVGSPKARSLRLATQEDDAVVSDPEDLGRPVVAVEPEFAAVVDHREDAEVAVRVGDCLHRDAEPLAAESSATDY